MIDVVAVDTEWAKGKPWCLSFSAEPGRSRVVMADNHEALSRLNIRLSDPSTTTVIHNCLYDLPVLATMGVYPAKVADTMIMAYLLCVEPQALKTLAYRHLGMDMHEYTDMVRPATLDKALGYLSTICGRAWPKPEPVEVWAKGTRRMKQPQNIEKKAWRIILDTLTKGADPWARWHKIEVEEGRGMVEAVLGPMRIGDLSDIDRDSAIRYSARDADATLRLYHILWPRIVADGLESVFWADMGAIPMIVDMMRSGIKIDPDHLHELSSYLKQRAEEVRVSILSTLHGLGIAVEDFNPNSWPQVAWVLYEKLGLVTPKGDSSTDNKTLSAFLESGKLTKAQHAIIQGVQDYRTFIKLKGTYTDSLPGMTDGAGRVHTTFKVTRTETGRLSSANPNLQNIPTRTEEGRRIRDAFVAPPGCKLLSVDLSQVEMRCAAHLSQDPEMLRVFLEDLDLHSQTASKIFGVRVEDIDSKKHRYPAKTVGFGVLYGMQPEGLQATLATKGVNWSATDCEKMIEEWFKIYSGVKRYMNSIHDHARRYGYVLDMFGRRRYIPHARSQDRRLQAAAMREAGNFPVQSTAQGIIKRAMAVLMPVCNRWRQSGVIWDPLIQIHDEILNQVQDDMVYSVARIEIMVMESVVALSVPVKADAKAGDRWGTMSKVEEAA